MYMQWIKTIKQYCINYKVIVRRYAQTVYFPVTFFCSGIPMFIRWHSTHRKRERNHWGEEQVLPSHPLDKEAREKETPPLTPITLRSPNQPRTTLETRASTHWPTGLQTPSRTALKPSVFIAWFYWGITVWGSQALQTFLLEYKRRMPTNTLKV